jgi:hypothetical protein
MNDKLKNRFKSLLWRAGGMSFVALAGYVLQVGDIWLLDIKMAVNIAIMAGLGLVVGEITKYLNS